jgi:predicted hotdog family 3-hydroxylacyl-ACP dehydratase
MLNPASLNGRVLDHQWIVAHIPHQGSMCLLDAVLEWSKQHLVCRATSHRDPANPLRQFGRLGAACGIEYAAQAMAVHGALLAELDQAGKQVHPGMLVSVRNVALHAAQLDDIAANLEIRVERLSGDAGMLLYAFVVQEKGRPLLDGRASVLLGKPPVGSQDIPR